MAATAIPLVALSWLGMRTLQQDRQLERQRSRERLEVAAGRVALDLERYLQMVEGDLASGRGIRFTAGGISSSTQLPILFQPSAAAPPNPVSRSFLAPAEVEEFQRRNLAAAAAEYRRAAASSNPSTRAAALLGLGRVLRQQGNRGDALHAYADLIQLGPVIVAGQPAGLVGRQGRCKVLADAGDVDRLRTEVADLAATLYSGNWRIDRGTFDLYREMVARWHGPEPSRDAIVRTEAAGELWRMWRRGDFGARGRRVFQQNGVPLLGVWVGANDGHALWLATPSELATSWRPLWNEQHLVVSLADAEGRPILGRPQAGGISLSPTETRLPFIVTASPTVTTPDGGTREAILISGLALAFVLIIAAAYGIYRATTRELLLAAQQSDFVSAVSHEFRTPLTSMRHLTDLLVSRDIASEERKTQYYELLAHETERLHRMVESLLSFGRMDAGAYDWRLEIADVGHMIRGNIEEFRVEPLAKGRQVVCDIEDGLPPIRADREALSRALWNLLENAAKYSEPSSPIRVMARRQQDAVLIAVGDEGAGIPRIEQTQIFQKFVRGSDAKREGIRGVGIGLALVKGIVEAHGGSVRLESEPGRGSTFTLVLPCLES